mgnify:CR=1 FL=1
MNIKFVLPALLVLCGAAYMSPVHAADYRCMVFSGADGGKPEASSNADGKYAIKAADLKAAEAGALAAATRYKKNSVTLTKAQCDAVAGASSTAASAPATATANRSDASAFIYHGDRCNQGLPVCRARCRWQCAQRRRGGLLQGRRQQR